MRVTTFRGETSIAALAGKVYKDLDATGRAKVEAALLKANPQLGRLDRLEVGAVVVVPEVPGVKHESHLDDPVEEATDFVARSLKDYGKHLAERHELHQVRLKAQAELAGDKDLKKAARDHPGGEQLLAQVKAATHARIEQAQEERERLAAALKAIKKTLAKL